MTCSGSGTSTRPRRFSHEAHRKMLRLHRAEQIDTGGDLVRIAAQGSNHRFIGTLIQSARPGGGTETSITALLRHPDWVEFSPQMELLRDLEVHVFSLGDYRPEEPVFILAVPPGTLRGGPGEEMPDSPLHQAIARAALHHGAALCHWHGRTQG